MERWLKAWLEHCGEWGNVWFGTLFWGSILGAGFLQVFPTSDGPTVYLISAACGATLGLVAKLRGRWV